MRRHDPTDDSGRNCWGSVREKERRRARHEIRRRVAEGVPPLSSDADGVSERVEPWDRSDVGDEVDVDVDAEGRDSERKSVAGNLSTADARPLDDDDDDDNAVLEYVRHIQLGHRSKFSLTAMASRVRMMNRRHDISVLDRAIAYTALVVGQKHGQRRADSLSRFVRSLSTFTLLEYAVWMERYSIVGNLVLGGIDPCIRSRHSTDPCSDTMDDRISAVGVRVLRRFFDWMPLPLSTYIIRRVMDFRIEAYHDQVGSHTSHRHDAGDDTDTRLYARYPCPVCNSSHVPVSLRLKLPACGHTLCEPCFWQYTLRWIDDCGHHDDVVVCPACHRFRNESVTQTMVSSSHGSAYDNVTPTAATAHEPSPRQKRDASLRKYLQLPPDRASLKRSSAKKKKVRDDDLISPTWSQAVSSSVGLTREVRKDKLFMHVNRPNGIHYVQGCLDAGADIDAENEYGQTALYIAAWRGDVPLFRLLLNYGAATDRRTNDGSSVADVINACGYSEMNELSDLLTSFQAPPENAETQRLWLSELRRSNCWACVEKQAVAVSTLIPADTDHPGAGSYTCDAFLDDVAVDALLRLWQSLPIEATRTKKNKKSNAQQLSSVRSHVCDAEGHVRRLLLRMIQSMGIAADAASCGCIHGDWDATATAPTVFPHMRVLNYAETGTELAAHIDLCRNWKPDRDLDNGSPDSGESSSRTGSTDKSTIRSTHSFLLYLTDCERGGETCLLNDVNGDGAKEVIATISPRRGRLLLFPHVCPHRGNAVIDVPKVLVRGEVYLPLHR